MAKPKTTDPNRKTQLTARTVWTTRETLVRFWPLVDIQSETDFRSVPLGTGPRPPRAPVVTFKFGVESDPF
jgi:hypothetical protein